MNPETENKKTLKEKNVKRLLGAALAVGAAGGLVRGIQLLSFDENGLPASAGGIHVAVWAILALEIAAAVAVWFVFGKRQICGRSGRSGLAEYLLPPAAAAVFALCAAVRLALSYKPFSAWGIILGIICFAVAASVPVVVKSLGKPSVSEGEKLISLLPVGAMIAIIIELYRSVAKTPSASLYAADVFATAVLILLFFSAAGDVNGKTGPQKVVAMGFAFVEIGTTAFLGRLIAVGSVLLSGAGISCILTHEFFEGLMALGGIAFAFAASYAVVRRGERPAEEPAPDEDGN
ncbi:MAG: hypothetical protein IKM29_01595 [Clostridia bacterium]|nr:hypothetical protein [Clostridia bacterium]